ncbi:glycoside-pentoside-hexuronide (GPH):cation symporter [Microbacterium oryzae]|uniref:MFS transporter n=1 Tax=Microbacterium oryzae TaxID=743009 RepID=UPI0025B08FE0|nr:glycoside-pentoside-hexuronide (GPH):cation symporter [Microbacterium oryzae]MDN3311590.1 glycoside-pentoside-hexuronide (GPH):cation symporter [Microbacterium oryzae]
MTQATDARPRVTPRAFGWRDRVGYMFGDLGNDFTFIFASAYLMVYFTNVAGLNPAHVGTLFLAARLIDAFTDVGWGRFLDRHRPSPQGRFRVWIARMAIPVAVASALMYAPFVADWDYGVKLTYAAVTYLLWGSICYTTTNISYGSMASVISDEPVNRASLSVFRGLGANIAGLSVSLLPPLFIYATIDGTSQVVPGRFFVTAIIFSVFAALFYFLCYAGVRERIQALPVAQPRSFGSLLRQLVSSRPLLTLIVANVVIMLASLFVATMAAYLWLYHFNNGAMSGPAQLTTYLPGLLLAPFAARLAGRFGKKEVLVVALFGTAAIYLALFFLHVQQPWVFILLNLLAGFGIGFYNLLIWAVVGDIIDAEEVRSGHRDDGSVYAINTWARKVGQAVAGGVGGYALAVIGFQSAAPTQDVSTVDGIYTFSTLAPAVLYAVAAVILLTFPLGRARVVENVAVLERRRLSKLEELGDR